MRRNYNEDDEIYDTEERYGERRNRGSRHREYQSEYEEYDDYYDEDEYEDDEEEDSTPGFPIKKVVYGVLTVALVGGILIGVVPVVQRVVLNKNAVTEQPIDTVSAVDNTKSEGTEEKPRKGEITEEDIPDEDTTSEEDVSDEDLFEDMEAEEVATPTPDPAKEQKKKKEAEKEAQKKESDASLSSKVGNTSKNGYLKVEGEGEGATNKNETYVVSDDGTVFAYFGSGVVNTAQTIYTSVDAATPIVNLEANTKVDIIDDIPDWYQIRTMDGTTGYIPKSSVTVQ